jgi:tyrosine-protein kinase Etk/Wzc
MKFMTSINNVNKEENLFTILINRFLPFWPLFTVLSVLFLLLAWTYMRFVTPSYEITASMVINDQMKGVNDPRITESINSFDSNKIVENEIEVMQSRDLMRKVVYDLHLYAPVFEDKGLTSVSAYNSSPVLFIVKNPEEFPAHLEKDEKFYFTYNLQSKLVSFNDETYPVGKFVKTPLGDVQFTVNKNFSRKAEGPLYFKLVHPKVVTNNLLKQFKVNSASKESSVINLELIDEVPERGEEILNNLIIAYNQATINDRERLAANTLEFIEERIQTLERELNALEGKIQQYKTANNIVDLSEQGKVYLHNVGENDRRMADINIQLAVLNKVEKYVSQQDSSASIVPATLGLNDMVLSQLLQKLQADESEYQKLRKTTATNNHIIISLSNAIERTRHNIMENIHNQRDNLEASRINLESTKVKYVAALQKIPIQERELLEINRQQATKKNVYSLLLEKREETALSYTPANLDTRIVEFAEASVLPVSPKRMIVYLVALILAFISGAVWVLGKEFLSRKILLRSYIEEHTNVPVVAEISRIKEKQIFPYKAPIEPIIIEQFRQLRISLGLYGKTIRKQKVLVTSSIPGEGKSFVSANLAHALASSGKKVALLDLDLRIPSISQLFGLEKEKGITDYLKGEAEVSEIIKATDFNGLSIVSAGIVAGDYSDMLLNGALDSMFSQLSKSFDYLVVDTPPLDLVTDGYLLSEYCDVSLLVVRYNYTPRAIVKNLEQYNKQQALHNLAIVFNDIKQRQVIKGVNSLGYGYGQDTKYIFKPVYKRNAMKSSA